MCIWTLNSRIEEVLQTDNNLRVGVLKKNGSLANSHLQDKQKQTSLKKLEITKALHRQEVEIRREDKNKQEERINHDAPVQIPIPVKQQGPGKVS